MLLKICSKLLFSCTKKWWWLLYVSHAFVLPYISHTVSSTGKDMSRYICWILLALIGDVHSVNVVTDVAIHITGEEISVSHRHQWLAYVDYCLLLSIFRFTTNYRVILGDL